MSDHRLKGHVSRQHSKALCGDIRVLMLAIPVFDLHCCQLVACANYRPSTQET